MPVLFNYCITQALLTTQHPLLHLCHGQNLHPHHPRRRRQSPLRHRHRRCPWQARLLLFWKLIAGARLANLHMLNPAECWSVCCRDYSTPAARLISETLLHSHSASKSIWEQRCIYWKHVYRCVCVLQHAPVPWHTHRAQSILVPWNTCRRLKKKRGILKTSPLFPHSPLGLTEIYLQ